jgi:nitrogen regulatory protein P-II 1
MRLEILADDTEVKAIIDQIVKSAATGNIGDGKVWAIPIEQVVRVRTGEQGSEAI